MSRDLNQSWTPDPTLAHRQGATSVQVLGPDGAPLADVEVTLAQTRHAFGFGNIGFDFIPLANGEHQARPEDVETFGGASLERLEQLAALWLDLFNTATLPFYWGRFEPVEGRPDTERLQRTAQWFAERGVELKGHPLMWHTVQPAWLLGRPLEEVERLQRARIRREVTDFRGLVDTWDAINEAVIMPVFDNGENAITPLARAKGRLETIRLAFDEARAANPDVRLLLNDFDMSTAYECLIEGVLEAGIEVDVLGLQSHMHQGYWGEEKTLATLERFSRYGLPIHFTETTLLSGEVMPPEIEDLNDFQPEHWPSTPEGEERQADEVLRHYRTLLSHPRVEATTYWGLTDDGMWLGAPGGFVRADGTPKPAYDELLRLVKGEWWLAPTAARTDAQGRVTLRGWWGDYEVSARGTSSGLRLEPGAAEVTARLA
ncbi:1,4-beta-xylanase [Cellulomonas sp. APG4]|uniref:endo-1,4-beta-xylanase n=1 Tax=Cellulomonas sp. APG4 TaxID=1538656 RepID=UPI001379E1D7|nr:endo-1,4-beta-xylanase [Cellulomonas sp. APG4]NCT91455.1 1,4-beta-xylanase [Cellulomonas sp. APG4]